MVVNVVFLNFSTTRIIALLETSRLDLEQLQTAFCTGAGSNARAQLEVILVVELISNYLILSQEHRQTRLLPYIGGRQLNDQQTQHKTTVKQIFRL